MTTWTTQLATTLSLTAADRCPTCQHVQTAGFWLTLGFVGQAIFTARFFTQWLASERRGQSVVPVVFWWLSLVGGGLLLIYAVRREDPVIILGQALGIFIYIRNLALINQTRNPQHCQGQRAGHDQRSAFAPQGLLAQSRPETWAASPLSDSALEPTLKRLRFDQDHAGSHPSSASLSPLSARLRAREDAL